MVLEFCWPVKNSVEPEAVVVHMNIGVKDPDTMAEQVKETLEPAGTGGLSPIIKTSVTEYKVQKQ